MTGCAPSRAYGFGTPVAAPCAEAVERTRTALKEQGFGVLTAIEAALGLVGQNAP